MGDNLAEGLKGISESLTGVSRMFQTAELTKGMEGGPYYDPEMAKLAYEQRRMDLNDLLIRARVEDYGASAALKNAKAAGGGRVGGGGGKNSDVSLASFFNKDGSLNEKAVKGAPAETKNMLLQAQAAAEEGQILNTGQKAANEPLKKAGLPGLPQVEFPTAKDFYQTSVTQKMNKPAYQQAGKTEQTVLKNQLSHYAVKPEDAVAAIGTAQGVSGFNPPSVPQPKVPTSGLPPRLPGETLDQYKLRNGIN